MRSLKTQYFLTYAVLGNLLPFLPVYLAARGLSRPQIGQVLAAGSFAILVTPTLVGFLADTHVDPRRLMAALCLFAGATAAALYFVNGFWPILSLYALHNLAFIPFISLQDGMNFSLQQDFLRADRRLGLITACACGARSASSSQLGALSPAARRPAAGRHPFLGGSLLHAGLDELISSSRGLSAGARIRDA